MKLACNRDERLARFRLQVRGVNPRQLARREPLAGDEVKQFKRILRRRLTVLFIRNQSATIIGGQNLRWLEMLSRERALARTGHAGQHDEGKLRDGEFHRVTTPISVTKPTPT